ncbi:unnamed protein product, partial [Hapterophycus canaliculatus]
HLPSARLPHIPPAGPPNSPSPPTGASHPSPWGAKHRQQPRRPRARGPRTAGSAGLRGDRRSRGSYRGGHPARAPIVRSPAAPAFPTQHNAATMVPRSLSPGPPGQGRFYTDSPTTLGG